MPETREEAPPQLTCPHCRKDFSAPLMAGAAGRYRGFKCPHCRLFVPVDRAGGDELLQETA